ncbi:hypothetical protein [Leptospira santarosai]|uniref:Uncharacterized protein n=1 Tax=Leptospira santarosai TaxID=28183 RepID=A0A2P1QVX3_9LEPT|nr:hypothetical protein [Leptospira santarosai]AVQ13036.1 Uncharacterized protein XB16_2732 [Leptospira santarosai]OLY65227.1 hypothetical protein BWD11_04815 [Leptospira santarosai serovar Grippotyphosa]ONF77638.1 hypothetical protein BWD12_14770 [Leptospira santarosai serovar Bananal]
MKKKKYYISVGEPWDFTGPDGENRIKGEILKIINQDCLLFKMNHHIEIKNMKGNIMVLFSRHRDNNFYETAENLDWTVNGGLLVTDEYENMNEKELEKNSIFSIIGGLHIDPD